jgi:restriction endonuclease
MGGGSQATIAKAFFKELKKKKKNVEYRTKLNSPELSTMISDILGARL